MFRRKAIAVGVAGIIIVMAVIGYLFYDWSKVVRGEGNFIWDVDWKPDGSYALVVGIYVRGEGEGFLYFPYGDDEGEIEAFKGKIWKYDGIGLTALLEWDMPQYGMPVKVSWEQNGAYALVWTFSELYKFTETGNTLTLISDDFSLTNDYWQPMGDEVILVEDDYSSDPYFVVYDGISLNTFDMSGLYFSELIWFDSGDYALVLAEYVDNRTSCVLRYDDSGLQEIWSNGSFEVGELLWCPSDGYVLISSRNTEDDLSYLLSYDGTQVSQVSELGGEYTMDISARPGTSEVHILAQNSLKIFEGNNLSGEVEAINTNARDIYWNPDGSYALIRGYDSLLKYDGTTLNEISGDFSRISEILWEPHGHYALFWAEGQDSDTTVLWKYEEGAVEKVPNDIEQGFPGAYSFHPDGDTILLPIYTDDEDGGLAEYDGNTMRQVSDGYKFEEKVNWLYWVVYAVLIVIVIIVLFKLKNKYTQSDETMPEDAFEKDVDEEERPEPKDTDERGV